MGGQDHLSGVTPLVGRVRAVLDGPRIGLATGAVVLVAVSGGPDSVALLHLTATARPDLRIVVAHVRHGLRDDAADAAAAAAAAVREGVPHVQRAVTVGPGQGPEDAARRARYGALREMAADHGAAAVLVGHTMDDQAETVLLRIARGTGITGLAGMDIVSQAHGIRLVRPLLGERRAVIRSTVTGLPTVEDPTNDDVDQRRARARHEALPALRRLHPAQADVVPLLARLAGFARQSAALPSTILDAHRVGMAVDVRLVGGGRIGQDQAALRAVWDRLPDAPEWPGTTVGRRLCDLAVGASADLPGGVRATRVADAVDRVVLCRSDTPVLPPVALPVGHHVTIPGFGALRAGRPDDERSAGDEGRAAVLDVAAWRGWSWSVPVDGSHPPLVVRGRAEDGDRSARRVLQTHPRALRRQVPLIVDARGRIVMAGHVVLRPPPSAGACLILTASP